MHVVSEGILSGSILGVLAVFTVMVATVIMLAYTCQKYNVIQKLKTSMKYYGK